MHFNAAAINSQHYFEMCCICVEIVMAVYYINRGYDINKTCLQPFADTKLLANAATIPVLITHHH